jgi:hypothetical protein
LEPKAKRGQITTKAEVKVAFEKRVGQQVAKSTIYRLLNRYQWRKLKPRPRHPKSDPEEQAVFKNTFAQQIQQFEQQRNPNDKRPLLVMASDEGRFGRIGGVHPCWCPPGFRPIISVQHVRQYIYAYAAVAPALGKMSCLILPYANTNMMSLFLKQVSADFADYFIVLQVDRAASHIEPKTYKFQKIFAYCLNLPIVQRSCLLNISGMRCERNILIITPLIRLML